MAARPDFDLLLKAFTSPDNGVRRQAEAAWEDVKRQLPDEVRTPRCRTATYLVPGTWYHDTLTYVLRTSCSHEDYARIPP